MNILVVGKFYADGFATHVAETLEGLGHSTARYDAGVRYSSHAASQLIKRGRQIQRPVRAILDRVPAYRRVKFKPLLRMLSAGTVDLSIVCHDRFLWPEEVARVKEATDGPVVLWFPDAISNLSPAYCLNAPYDALFFKDPYIINVLRRLTKTPVYYLPECFNIRRHRLDAGLTDNDFLPYACEITTAGNLHSARVALFKNLAEYDVKIWGNPPPLWLELGPVGNMFQRRYVVNGEKALAFRAAKIVLNSLHPTEILGVNARTFEAAGMGAFQLIDWRAGLHQLFRIDEEIVAFRGLEDLKEKIDYYLANEDERVLIAERARQRAVEDHTYELRLDLLLRTVFEGAGGFEMPRDLEVGWSC